MPKAKRSSKAGLPPGTLVHIGEAGTAVPCVTLYRFSQDFLEERGCDLSQAATLLSENEGVTWVHIQGLRKEEVETLGRSFRLHPLLLEDVLNTQQRPKMEDFEDYIFLVLRAFDVAGKAGRLRWEQVSLFFGRNFVVSFQETGNPLFAPVVERLRTGKGRLRGLGPDYLTYSLVDVIVDGYFAVMESISDRVDGLEEELLSRPARKTMDAMHQLKKQVINLRRAVWPLRDTLNTLGRSDSSLVKDATHVYLKDVYDHTVQVIDTAEWMRELLSEMMDIYLSSISNRLNEVVRFLTAVSTIFIPMTFLASLYGMNFVHMPLLRSFWGFWAMVLLMSMVGGSFLWFFRTRKWL